MQKFKNLFSSEFAKNVLTLMTGTTIAQAIPIAISPILTRIYTPEDFGVLALFLSITAVTGAIANGKYEQAIVLPVKNSEAIEIVVLSVIIATIFSTLLLFLIVLFSREISLVLGNVEIENWLYFIPFSTLFIGLFNSLNYYNVRIKKFKNISIAQVTKSSSLSLFQVVLGFIKQGAFGLIVGQLISYISGNYILYKELKKEKPVALKLNKNILSIRAKQYIKFPKYSLPSIFLNSITLNSINILISTIFSLTTLGYYSLTQRIIGIPARVIGSSFSQVYFQKASQLYNKTNFSFSIFYSTLKKLVLIAFPIFTISYFIVKPVFTFVFGDQWAIAGEYAQILMPLAFVRFLSSSLSSTCIVHQKQQYGLIINIILIITVIILFVVAHYFEFSFTKTLIYMVIILSFEYLMFLLLYAKISQGKI